MDEQEYKPQYARRALFVAEDNKLRIMTLEKKVAVMEKQLSTRIDDTQSAVQGISIVDASIEVVAADKVKTATSTVLKTVVPYVNDKLGFSDYLLLSAHKNRLQESDLTAPRLQLVPAAELTTFSHGGVQMSKRSVQLPAYSVLDGKSIHSIGFASGSGNLMFTQAIIEGGITKKAGEALTVVATLCFVYK